MASSYPKSFQISFFLFFLLSGPRAQTSPENGPKIGDSCPAFIFDDLHYYTKNQASYSDFKGTPIIIDFFSQGCKACFLSFPHVDSLKKEFEGKIQFIMVGKKSPGIQKQYENYMKHYGLTLAVDYEDSTLWNQFGVVFLPYTVWIDANGIIRQTTGSSTLTRTRLNNFIQGKEQSLSESVNINNARDGETKVTEFNNFFDIHKPLLIGGNGGADTSFLFRSVLSKWDYRTYFHRDFNISARNKNKVQEIGVSLKTLFTLAYGDTVLTFPITLSGLEGVRDHYNQWAAAPEVESARRSLFESDTDSSKNIFNYSLIVHGPNLSGKKLQEMMQRDLRNYFSMEATVEIRNSPCWIIVADKNAEIKLKTKGGEPEWGGSFSSVIFKNQPMSSLVTEIWSYFQTEPAVFLDETGITSHIDLRLDAVMSDIYEVKKALQKNGLDLVRAERPLKVIVIRDLKD